MKGVRFALAACGLSATLIQLSVLRESLKAYQGNEMVLGLGLGIWLLFVGAGSYLAGRLNRPSLFSISIVFSSAMMPFTVFLCGALPGYLVESGESPGLTEMMAATMASFGIYCLLYGFQITSACALLSKKPGVEGIRTGYALDSLGCVFGGAIFSFILVDYVDPMGVAYIAAAFSLIGFLAVPCAHRLVASFGVCAILLLSTDLDLGGALERAQYPGQHIIAKEDSRYGELALSESYGQYSFFESGVALFSQDNAAASEETVHYAMSQVRTPRKVLLIGGGVSGTLNELLKYPGVRVDYVEPDPKLIGLVGRFVQGTGLDDSRVRVINQDGRYYVKDARETYDAVIVDLPEPTNTLFNRYYTIEFFRQAKLRLAPGGVFSTRLGGSADYLSEQEQALNSATYATLRQAFQNVLVLPGGKNVFLASDVPLSSDIASAASARGIATRYVDADHLRGIITPDRVEWLRQRVSAGAQIDSDQRPLGYYLYLRLWMKRIGLDVDPALAAIVLVLLLAALYLMVSPAYGTILAVGFTATSLEYAILISFQSVYGYVYHQMGFIVTAFMAGLVAAAYLIVDKSGEGRVLRSIAAASAGFCILMSFFLAYSPSLPPTLLQAAYPLAAFILGALTGAALPNAGAYLKRRGMRPAGELFGLDYLGSFAGVLVTSVFLLPTAGILTVCALCAAVNIGCYLRLRDGPSR